jgi:2-polyprenyl-6-methoxyphenol hydroxylase-like FAD-dependent oxidoreductase
VMLGIELARRGVEVRVLDGRSTRSPESRAIAIHARTLELFHRLGVVEKFLEDAHRVDGFVFHTRARRNARMGFGGLDSPYPFMLTLSQEVTQRILDERLESLGVTIDRGVTVLGVDRGRDGVALRVRGPADRPERTLLAEWVVGCDGAHSSVRGSLGLAFDGDDYGQDWLMTEVNVDWPLRRDLFHVFSYTPAPLPMFPLPGGRWRVFMPQVPNRAVGAREAPGMAEIERLVAQRGPVGMRLTDPTLLSAFRCYRRRAKIMRRGRVLIAGDAAHIHSPAGGQGMNIGLHDAVNLGWKLGMVATGQASQQLLDTYEQERVPIAADVLRMTHGLVRTFTLASPRARRVRDRLLPALAAIPSVERRYTARLAQLSHTYRGGPLARTARGRGVAPGRGAAPGDRLPVVTGLLRAGAPVSMLELLGSPKHTALIFAGARAHAEPTREAITRLEPWSSVSRAVVITERPGIGEHGAVADPGLRAHRRYQALGGELLLVRPDGHLACRAPLERADVLTRYLERLTSGAGTAAERTRR